jgi:hypothetical protein
MISLFKNILVTVLSLSVLGIFMAAPLFVTEVYWMVKLIVGAGLTSLVVLSFLTVGPYFQNFLSNK